MCPPFLTSPMFRRLRQCFSFLFGNFSWKPPGWLARPISRLAAAIKSHPRHSAAIALLLLALAGGGWWACDWQQRQPKPVTISVKVEAPGATKLEKELQPAALFIVFGA